ncbi:MAG: HEPN domain-containing protein, partial [Thermoplasmata archaeon]
KSIGFKEGYREKSHFCLIIAMEELYVKEDKLNSDMVENLELCKRLRHESDYGLTYHQESAKTALKYAKEFLDKTLNLI